MAQAAFDLNDWQAKRSGTGICITGRDRKGNVHKLQATIIDVQGQMVLASDKEGNIWNLGSLR